jgi:hypothetical protein
MLEQAYHPMVVFKNCTSGATHQLLHFSESLGAQRVANTAPGATDRRWFSTLRAARLLHQHISSLSGILHTLLEAALNDTKSAWPTHISSAPQSQSAV